MRISTRYQTIFVCALTSALGLLAIPGALTDEPPADALLREAHELGKHASQLRREGHNEAAERAVMEARELVAAAERRTGDQAEHMERQAHHEHLAAMAREVEELQEQGKTEAARELAKRLTHVRREMAERQAQGRPEAARAPRERIERMEREPRERARRTMEPRPHEGHQPGPPPEIEEAHRRLRAMQNRRDDDPQPPPDIEEAHRRLHHLEVAIENLHAAGLHEPAEHIEAVREEMLQDLERRAQAGHPRHPPHEMIEHLQGQIHELRQAIEELREKMHELLQRMR